MTHEDYIIDKELALSAAGIEVAEVAAGGIACEGAGEVAGSAATAAAVGERLEAVSKIAGTRVVAAADAPLTDEDYMRMALAEARAAAAAGEVPIGAVVVYAPVDPATRRPLAAPRVIARNRNRRETDANPAGHAEFLAMLDAARELQAWRLTGCTVYVTLEPCVMCAGLMHQARIDRCVWGAADPKAGALGTLYEVHADERLNHNFSVTGGVLANECAQLLQEFFAAKRKARKTSGAEPQPGAAAASAESESGVNELASALSNEGANHGE